MAVRSEGVMGESARSEGMINLTNNNTKHEISYKATDTISEYFSGKKERKNPGSPHFLQTIVQQKN